jgi:hypothetical protein
MGTHFQGPAYASPQGPHVLVLAGQPTLLSFSLSLFYSTLIKFPSIIVTLVRDLDYGHSTVSTSASRKCYSPKFTDINRQSLDTVWRPPRRSGPRYNIDAVRRCLPQQPHQMREIQTRLVCTLIACHVNLVEGI